MFPVHPGCSCQITQYIIYSQSHMMKMFHSWTDFDPCPTFVLLAINSSSPGNWPRRIPSLVRSPSSGGVWVSRGLVYKWGKNRAGDRQADRGRVCHNLDSFSFCRVEERAESDGKALWFWVYLCFNPHLWSWTAGKDSKSETVNTNIWNESPLQGGWT